MSDNTRFDPRFDPAFQPGYDGPIAEAQPAKARPAAVVPEALPVVQAPAAPEPDAADDLAPRRTNPFVIALAVAALLFLGGGLYLVSRLRDLFADTQSTSAFDYTTLQVLLYGAPLVLVLGLATGVGLLFLLAIRWDRR